MSTKSKLVRLIVLSQRDLNNLFEGNKYCVIQSYNAAIPDHHTFARDCAKLSGAVVLAELSTGEFEVVQDYSPRRRDNRQTA